MINLNKLPPSDNIRFMVKKIDKLLDLIIEDFAEIINYLKYSENLRQESQSLVFSKKRALSICDKIAKIFSLLVKIKYKKMETWEESKSSTGFNSIIDKNYSEISKINFKEK